MTHRRRQFNGPTPEFVNHNNGLFIAKHPTPLCKHTVLPQREASVDVQCQLKAGLVASCINHRLKQGEKATQGTRRQ